MDFNAPGQFAGFGEAATLLTEECGGVGFVEHEPRAVCVLQLDDFAERGEIAVHAEDTFCDDENARKTRGSGGGARGGPLQFPFEVAWIVVGEDTELRAAEMGGIDDTGVDELVHDNDVVLVEQRADGAECGGVAGRKSERGLCAFEVGESFIEIVVNPERAADEPRCAGACAEIVDGPLRRLLERVVIGQPEVIVRRKVEERTAVD